MKSKISILKRADLTRPSHLSKSAQNDKSDSNLPEISHVIVSNVRKSIAGEELRNIRLQNDYTLNFEESIIPTQSTTEKLPNHKSSSLMRIEAATLFVSQRLLALNLQLSPTQNHTPMDGNCLIHSLMDQMTYDEQYSAFNTHHLTLRAMIVNSLKTLPSNRNLEWPISNNPIDGNRETWSEKMRQSGVFCDDIFLQVASNFLNRTLILVPVFAEEGHNERGEIIKSPAIDLGFEPFYILYYSEIRFEVGHFQSIRPNSHSQPTQMKEIPETIEEISPPIYQSSILSKKSIESTQVIQSSQMSEDSTQLVDSSQLSVKSKPVKKTRSKNKRELSYLDNSCILPDCKRTRNRK